MKCMFLIRKHWSVEEGKVSVTEEQIDKALKFMAQIVVCCHCATRIRFGDYECPHCGADIEEDLRTWAMGLLRTIE